MFVRVNDCKILAFYGYPTIVLDEVGQFNEFEKRGDLNVKRFFDDILTKAENTYRKSFKDNKIAFYLEHILTGTKFYVGMKDGCYRIGFSVAQEWKHVIDLTK